MRLFLLECKKIVFKRGVWIVIALLLAANMFQIYDRHRNRGMKGKELEGYQTVYSRVRGPLTVEGIQFVVNEAARLKEIVDSGRFSPQFDPNTYTGYMRGDSDMMQHTFLAGLKYHYGYAAYAEDIVRKSDENIRLYSERGNRYNESESRQIVNSFAGRHLDSFYSTIGYEALFAHELSSFFILLICLFVFTPMVIYEREANMLPLLLTSKKGKNRVTVLKYVVAGLFLISVCALFFTMDFLMVKATYGLDGGGNPLYSIQAFRDTPLNTTVFGYYLITCLVKTAGIAVFSALFLLVSALAKRALHGFVVNVFVMLGLIVLALFDAGHLIKLFNLINPARLLSCRILFTKWITWDIFGLAVQTHRLRLVLAVVLFAAVGWMAVYFNRKTTPLLAKKGVKPA